LKPLRKITSKAVPLDMPNVDTDQIIPKQFLKRVERTGFGQFLFYDWRLNEDGSLNESFILNQDVYNGAQVLLARDNFGCGSSREHAPWALLDYGFKIIIAPSFADIFYNNCFQNGMLPLKLNEKLMEELFQREAQEAGRPLTVDLEKLLINAGDMEETFELEPNRQRKLLEGLDDIGWTLSLGAAISEYETNRNSAMS
jgi:3-isopropylmalate/(R)-2-methylmalate dehydratase small subunit